MIKLLEQYGAKAISSPLFESAIEEQKRLKERTPKTANRKAMAKAEGASGSMSEAMNALKERGDRIEKLDKRTADLQNDAQNYAEMAKQLKEKTKKKSTFFGL
jgi:predicted transcriptional regulator